MQMMPCHNSRIPWGYKLGTDLQLLLGIRVCALRLVKLKLQLHSLVI